MIWVVRLFKSQWRIASHVRKCGSTDTSDERLREVQQAIAETVGRGGVYDLLQQSVLEPYGGAIGDMRHVQANGAEMRQG